MEQEARSLFAEAISHILKTGDHGLIFAWSRPLGCCKDSLAVAKDEFARATNSEVKVALANYILIYDFDDSAYQFLTREEGYAWPDLQEMAGVVRHFRSLGASVPCDPLRYYWSLDNGLISKLLCENTEEYFATHLAKDSWRLTCAKRLFLAALDGERYPWLLKLARVILAVEALPEAIQYLAILHGYTIEQLKAFAGSGALDAAQLGHLIRLPEDHRIMQLRRLTRAELPPLDYNPAET